jgi:hypothetical protein
MVDESERNPVPRPLGAPLLRVVLGLILLLGPLFAVERFMRGQPQWLRPVLRPYPVAMDMKLLFIEHRGACPDLVTFGSSLTDHALPPRHLAEHTLMGAVIEDPFDFALAEVRGTNMLAQYRWLRRRGCKPDWIIVEVSPVVINGEHGGQTHDPALLSARALLGMPEGFAKLRAYTVADQLELATLERLLIHRRRRQIVERALNSFDAELWFMSEDERAEATAKPRSRMPARPELELDGKLTPPRRSLTTETWATEQLNDRRRYRRGIYKWRVNEPEQQAITQLVREAAGEHVGVILHAPPVMPLYHRDIAPKLGIAADFAQFVEEIQLLADELPKVVWHDAYTDSRYKLADFADWIHLSQRGGERYVNQLIDASNIALQMEHRAR